MPRPTTPHHDTTSPLAYMLALMRDETLATEQRLKAAIAAAPYCHSTCKVIRPAACSDEASHGMTSLPARPPLGH